MESENEYFCRITCRDIGKLFYCYLWHTYLLFFLNSNHDATLIMAEAPGNEAEL